LHGDVKKRLTELLAKALPAPSQAVSADHEICGLAYHSAEVQPGDLFVAVRGFSRDGHDYAAEAVRRGAPAVVVDHVLADMAATQVVVPDTRRALAALAAAFYGDPSRHLWLCGVTGTNGKTTTTHLIHAILSAAGHRSAVVGTIGVVAPEGPPAWHSSTSTTPEAPDLQRLLRDLRSRAVRDVVIEVTSHALELSRVACCRFQAAVFTNLTQDHLDFHGDLIRYRDAKCRLFAMVDPPGVSVVNADDPASRAMAAASRARVVTYGIDAAADVRAVEIVLTANGTRFSVVWPGGRQPLWLRLPGRFNVANALAAFAVGQARGVAPEEIAAALESVNGVPGRCELVDEGQPFAVLVDYAHSPDSLEKILRLAAQVSRGRRIVVFGCGGDRDRTKRPIMGRIGTQLADYAVFTSDNPRGENPLAIIREIEAGATGARNFESIPDRWRAIERGIALAQPGDVVVIAGKGHETYQIQGERIQAFDDREVAREVLRARQEGVGARP
jgi:UDP-N-acetylmuramoyl-L-alanyl-D-glutamate--2,6-diaminopimelate ligase